MTCNEFKEKIVDLFDLTVEAKVKAELEQHMADCPDCRTYYEELAHVFGQLQPGAELNTTGCTKIIPLATGRGKAWPKIWWAAAAAVLILLGLFLGRSMLMPTEAMAAPAAFSLDEAIRLTDNSDCFQMTVYARTKANENFAYFDVKEDFVRTDISFLRQNDSVFYRVEKGGTDGRTVICDGKNQYLLRQGRVEKGSVGDNFLENYSYLLYPARLLRMQKHDYDFLNSKGKVAQTETDSAIVITITGIGYDCDIYKLYETGQRGQVTMEIQDTFSKKDKLLRSLKVWVYDNGTKTLIMYADNIHYNAKLDKSNIVALPEGVDKNAAFDLDDGQNIAPQRLKMLRNENAMQSAKRVMEALARGKAEEVREFFEEDTELISYYTKKFKGCRISGYEEIHPEGYSGTMVKLVVSFPDNTTKETHIAMTRNAQQIWVHDGGL